MATLTKYKTSAMKVKRTHPWTLLPASSAYDDNLFHNALRQNTALISITMYQSAIDAVRYFVNADEENAGLLPYRLVRKEANGKTQYSLEILYQEAQPGASSAQRLVLTYTTKDNSLFGTVLIDDQEVPISDWTHPHTVSSSLNSVCLSFAVAFLLIPKILEMEKELGEDGLKETLQALSSEFKDMLQYSTADEFSDDERNHLYYISIILECMDKIQVNLNKSGYPDMIPDLKSNHLSGQVIAQNYSEKICYVEATSKANRYSNCPGVTMAEAIAMYSSYSADRNWTPAEKLLIPKFKDDMLVMPEVLRFAKRICDTKDDINPVVTMTWCGVTSYGKSTGVAQLAAILNMPLMKITCHSNMETQDFLTQYVPKTGRTKGISVRRTTTVEESLTEITSGNDAIPYQKEAIEHIAAMTDEERTALFNAQDFYMDASMDSGSAFTKLTGLTKDEDPSVVFALYAVMLAAYQKMEQEKELEKVRKELEEAKQQKQEGSNKPEFEHVASNYVKALVNGYLIEVQEPSRIRDQGVLVGLNELDHAGAIITMMDGHDEVRHPRAIQIATDNVGYSTCHQYDPSYIRRQALIIDSCELTKEQLFDRIKWNTHCTDKKLMNKAYTVWCKVKEYCEDNAIEDGCVTATELERLVQAVMYDGPDSFETNLNDCLISKATRSVEDQQAIRAVLTALTA